MRSAAAAGIIHMTAMEELAKKLGELPEGRVLAGFSGGADSTAMMFLLAGLRDTVVLTVAPPPMGTASTSYPTVVFVPCDKIDHETARLVDETFSICILLTEEQFEIRSSTTSSSRMSLAPPRTLNAT